MKFYRRVYEIKGFRHRACKCFCNYNTCFSIENNGEHFLIDGGGGKQILRNLNSMGININEISHAFITHNHTDHLLGFIWVTRFVFQGLSRNLRTKDFHIYGSETCLSAVEKP